MFNGYNPEMKTPAKASLQCLLHTTDIPRSYAYLPNNNLAIRTSKDIQIWNLRTNKRIKTIPFVKNSFFKNLDFAYLPNGYLADVINSSIFFWNIRNWKQATIGCHSPPPNYWEKVEKVSDPYIISTLDDDKLILGKKHDNLFFTETWRFPYKHMSAKGVSYLEDFVIPQHTVVNSEWHLNKNLGSLIEIKSFRKKNNILHFDHPLKDYQDPFLLHDGRLAVWKDNNLSLWRLPQLTQEIALLTSDVDPQYFRNEMELIQDRIILRRVNPENSTQHFLDIWNLNSQAYEKKIVIAASCKFFVIPDGRLVTYSDHECSQIWNLSLKKIHNSHSFFGIRSLNHLNLPCYTKIEQWLKLAEENPSDDLPLFKLYFLIKKYKKEIQENLIKHDTQISMIYKRIKDVFKINASFNPNITHTPHKLLTDLKLSEPRSDNICSVF